MTDDVRLSCSPVSSFVYRWTFLYPYTNTPPRDLAITSRGLTGTVKQPIRALLLGCSDLSSVAHTMYLNSVSGTFDGGDWSTTPIQAVCCDFEPCVIARSLVYLQIVMKGDMSVSTMALAWEAVHCEIVSPETASLMRDAIGELCVMLRSDESWADSLLAKCGVSVTGNKQKVIDLLLWWKDTFDNGDFSDAKVVQKVLEARKCIPERLGRKGTQVDLLVASVVTKNKAFSEAVDEFEKDGFVGVANICPPSSDSTIVKISPIGSHKRTTLNPTFFADKCNLRKAVATFNKKTTVEGISKFWRVHYGANPYCCIAPELADILATMTAPQTDFASSSACCKRGTATLGWAFEAFGLRTRALAQGILSRRNKVVWYCGDAFALCDVLRPDPRAWSLDDIPRVKAEVREMTKLGVPRKFDFIDTSNLADNLGALSLLLSASTLLAPRSENPRATLATDVMKALGLSDRSVIKRSLCGVPLWMVPYACGVQLDRLHSEEHQDSQAKADPSLLWTPYPRSVTSIMMSMAMKDTGAGSLVLRWRRCPQSVDEIRVKDSPQMQEALFRVLEYVTVPHFSMPTGIALMSRLVDSLARSDYLVCAKDDLFALLCEASLQKRMERNPMHPSVGCYEALRLSLSLHGVFPYEKVFMTSTPMYEVLLEMPCTWTEKAPYDTMSQKDIDRSADYRTVEVCFRHPAGIYISFPARMISDRQLVAVIPRIVYDSSLHGGTTALFKSVESICGLTEIPTKLIRVKEVPRRVLGEPCQRTSSLVKCTSVMFTTREWLTDGCLRFVVKFVDQNKLKLLQQKKPISVRLCPSDPTVVEVLTADSCLASFSMVADVAINNVHLKVSRSEGILNLTIPVTYGQRLTAKDTSNGMPRAILGTSQCAVACPTLNDQALSSINNTGGWVNVCLMGRQVPVAVRGNLESAMNCLRQTVGCMYATTLEDREKGRPWKGRAIATLECGDMTQAVLLLSGEVRYDWNWGPTIRAGVYIFGDEVPKDLKAELRKVTAKYGTRELLCDKASGELECFVNGYVPAAVELANISRGVNGDVDASSGEDFWMPWLHWESSPLSAAALSHFKPMVVFPVYSPMGVDNDISTENKKSPTDMLEEMQRKMFEDPELMKRVMTAAETGADDGELENLLRSHGAGITGDLKKKKGKKTTTSKRNSGSVSSGSAGGSNGHAAAASNDHQCEVCGKTGGKACSRCKNVFYCSVECQRRAWPSHKKTKAGGYPHKIVKICVVSLN